MENKFDNFVNDVEKEGEKKESKMNQKVELTYKNLTFFALILVFISLFTGILSSYIFVKNKGIIYQSVNSSTSGESTTQVGSVVDKAADSVVEITTESVANGSIFQQYVTSGAGSGVIISTDGYIVTNNHVIENAKKITVKLRNGSEYEAKLIGTDAVTDLGVIKIDGASDLKPATLGESSTLKVGDQAIVIGNPLGELGGTVTSGIISALEREITIDGNQMTLLQIDAPVNPGNSGGGLFNANGDLIGIINAKSSGSDIEGIGFAIPIDTAKTIIDELIKNGKVTGRPSLGMSVTEIAQSPFNEGGVYVQAVEDNSSVSKAGIKAGDRIISVDGTVIKSAAEIKSIILKKQQGDEITIQVERDGKVIDAKVTLQ